MPTTLTLTLDGDALLIASAFARARSLDLGQAVSELIRRGGAGRPPLRKTHGVWTFDLPADTAPLTARKVRRMLGDLA
jgi:hypothetical protein